MSLPTLALLRVWRSPAEAGRMSLREWSDVLGATRRSRTLAHLALRLRLAGADAAVPERVARHFASIEVLVADRRRRVAWELSELATATRDLDVPLVLLKGAAYEVQGLALASGRLVSDVDLLVPAGALADVERHLLAGGWEAAELDDYDERYYRRWSHELPPFKHPERGLEVDVHHSITPAMRGAGVDSGALIAVSVPVRWDGRERFRVLAPVDQLIHCAIHTFKDSDLSLRLRETMDFDLLWRHHAGDRPEAFARELAARAIALGQRRPLWWAIHFARRWLGTPIPEDVSQALGAPRGTVVAVMERLADRAMLPGERIERGVAQRWSAVALLARYHYHRMPFWRLVPHLLEKSRQRLWVTREAKNGP